MVSRHLCLLVLLQSACGFVTPDVACSRVDVKPRFRPVTLAASSPIVANAEADLQAAAPPPLPRAIPCGDPLDQRIWKLALPAFVNFLILPITGAVDLFFIGKLGSALATAGQAAANQVYSTAALLTNVVPIVTVPLIAKAHAANDEAEVQRQVGGAIFLSFLLSSLVALLVGLGSTRWLLLVGSSAALPFSLPYLLWRLPGVLPDAFATVGFSTFRGTQDTVTPLQISLVSSLVNLVANPLLMFTARMGMAGAALATSASQIVAGCLYLSVLLRRNLLSWASAIRPPSKELLAKLAAAAGAVQVRNIALNVAFVTITKTTQRLDTTGVAAAAHATTIALWQLGGVVLFAMGSVATILTSAELGKADSSRVQARAVARRLLSWGMLLGAGLGVLQILALPLLKVFSPLAEVRQAARLPSLIGALLQLISGAVFVGEGLMVASGAFAALAAGQVAATAFFLLALRLLPPSLVSVWLSFWVFNTVRLLNFGRFFYLADSPLAREDQLRSGSRGK